MGRTLAPEPMAAPPGYVQPSPEANQPRIISQRLRQRRKSV